jgi:hypothetical protein
MGVVGTVVVEADALVWNSDCRVAPARTLVLFPPSRFFRLCRCGTLLRGSTFPGNRLWAHVCSESCSSPVAHRVGDGEISIQRT